MIVYVTKYALTDGVVVIKAENTGDGFVRVKTSSGLTRYLIVGRECFRTEKEALEKAETVRKEAIKSAKRKIEKLEKMKFEVHHADTL